MRPIQFVRGAVRIKKGAVKDDSTAFERAHPFPSRRNQLNGDDDPGPSAA
jgi:hypothetical protein